MKYSDLWYGHASLASTGIRISGSSSRKHRGARLSLLHLPDLKNAAMSAASLDVSSPSPELILGTMILPQQNSANKRIRVGFPSDWSGINPLHWKAKSGVRGFVPVLAEHGPSILALARLRGVGTDRRRSWVSAGREEDGGRERGGLLQERGLLESPTYTHPTGHPSYFTSSRNLQNAKSFLRCWFYIPYKKKPSLFRRFDLIKKISSKMFFLELNGLQVIE